MRDPLAKGRIKYREMEGEWEARPRATFTVNLNKNKKHPLIRESSQGWMRKEINRRRTTRRRANYLAERSDSYGRLGLEWDRIPATKVKNRETAGYLIALRTGHGDFAEYHHRFHHEITVYCGCEARFRFHEHFFHCSTPWSWQWRHGKTRERRRRQ
jgi:hypothetical protein